MFGKKNKKNNNNENASVTPMNMSATPSQNLQTTVVNGDSGVTTRMVGQFLFWLQFLLREMKEQEQHNMVEQHKEQLLMVIVLIKIVEILEKL